MITADARAAGMGELGVATSADNYSQHWNPAKYAFAENEKGVGLSYTPYLSKLVDDIFLGNITFYKKVDDRSSWATSLRYFSLGDIQFRRHFRELVENTFAKFHIPLPFFHHQTDVVSERPDRSIK